MHFVNVGSMDSFAFFAIFAFDEKHFVDGKSTGGGLVDVTTFG